MRFTRLNRRPLAALAAASAVVSVGGSASATLVDLPASTQPRYYSVDIDTSSLAGGSGDIVFQAYSPGFGFTAPVSGTATVQFLQSDSTYTYTIPDANGVNHHRVGANQGFELVAGGNDDSNYNPNAELDFSVSNFGSNFDFDVEFSGNTLNGEDPQAGNYLTGFDLMFDEYQPNGGGGQGEDQVLLDDEGYGTFEYYGNGPNMVVEEENPAVTVTQISGFPSVPEPTSAAMMVIAAATLVRRSRRRTSFQQ